MENSDKKKTKNLKMALHIICQNAACNLNPPSTEHVNPPQFPDQTLYRSGSIHLLVSRHCTSALKTILASLRVDLDNSVPMLLVDRLPSQPESLHGEDLAGRQPSV